MILNSLFLLTIIIVTAVGIVLWWRIYSLTVQQRQCYLDKTQSTPVGMLDFVVAFTIWLGIPTVAISLLPFDVTDLEKLEPNQTNIMLATIATAQLVGCVLIITYLSLVRYGSLTWMMNLKPSLGNQIILAFKAFCMIIPIILSLQALLSLLIPYQHETLSQLSENFSVTTILTTWYGAVIAAPLCEEIVFRGVLQSWLQRVYLGNKSEEDRVVEIVGGWSNPLESDAGLAATIATEKEPLPVRRFRWWFPIIISSALFAVIHIGQGAAPIPLFLFAVGLGFLFRYSGSLVPCIILHFLLNGFTMFWRTLSMVFGE